MAFEILFEILSETPLSKGNEDVPPFVIITPCFDEFLLRPF